jgi:GntR family transcriptional regulator, rspAB operon transcriptional repressor
LSLNPDRSALVRSPKRQTDPAPPRPGARLRAGNAAHLIYRELREDIVSMRRKPGEPIVEREIALAHGVSRTPVREALLRLADEHLIEIFPQSGTFVARIPVSALPEAILMRAALEQTTARLAAERADAAQVRYLYELLERQRRVQARGARDLFHEADEAFHAAIAQTAGHPGIWQFIEQVKMQVDRYRHLTLPVPGRMKRVLAEHAAIVGAVEAHDGPGAAAAMAAHLENLRASIGDVRELNPDYFVDRALPVAAVSA